MSQLPQIDYTSRDFETIVNALESHVRQTRPEEWSDFFRSNLGETLIELNAMVGDIMSFNLDSVGSEVFLSSARRYESALRFARSVGYVPQSATPAETTVQALSIPESVSANGALIQSGAAISGPEGVRYELLTNAYITPGSTGSALNLKEGESFEETFSATGQPGQQVVTSNGVVADGSWEVFVGTPSEDTKWTQVESVTVLDDETQVYEVSFTGDGRLRVQFGGSTSGSGNAIADVPNDTITVRYRTTAGAAGNAPIQAIRGSFSAELGVRLDDDNLPIPGSGIGQVTNITYQNTTSVATGGQDRESLEALRVNIPAFLRSLDKLIATSDYDSNVRRVPGGGVALSFTEPYVSSFRGNHMKVNVWSSEDIDFTSETPATANQTIESTVTYSRYAQMPFARINTIRDFVDERTVATVNNVILRPNVAWLDLYLGDVVYDPAASKEDLHKRITQAAVDYFENASGFAFRVADFYNTIDAVSGVRHFYIDRMVAEITQTGTLKFTAQPSSGDTVSIIPEQGAASTSFEFSNGGGVSSDVEVVIQGSLRATILEFVSKVNDNLNVYAKPMYSTSTPPEIARIDYAERGPNLATQISVSGSAIEKVDPNIGDVAKFLNDHRRDQFPLDDRYPPGSPENEPLNYDPPSSLSAGAGQNSGWQQVGVKPYRIVRDIVGASQPAVRRFYDNTFLYNNEIFYDSVANFNEEVEAINLRRLVFNLVTRR